MTKKSTPAEAGPAEPIELPPRPEVGGSYILTDGQWVRRNEDTEPAETPAEEAKEG